MNPSVSIDEVETCRMVLEQALKKTIQRIGLIKIGEKHQFPFGWRKAAKGRTVWRLLEETISQTLEATAQNLGLENFSPSAGEVSIYDFSFQKNKKQAFVNIKSAVAGTRPSKDDVSKARLIQTFFETKPDCIFLIATIELAFLEDPFGIELRTPYVVPLTWLPDIYVNPSNNGNLQSSRYKDVSGMVRRTNAEFLSLLNQEIATADRKRAVR